ncbi:DUF2490 domain-containing protein [Betaproteobacteria bacterium PRO4]|uniref:DUF2490 domain-containing protein n=1 Tax=Nitrosomonas sp. TaxID=42353 RepID=UPI00256DFA9E|nr:DUF2490 domain-containing protein [Nitrosomonas sp.]MBE7526269.1 DUF2490 domain-containing protein [Burkholderiales bacterium]MDL1867310.1 DUF2490 domain-containing protein [Betaproteobacteria bacterium PRO4]
MFKKISISGVLVALSLTLNQSATAGRTVEDFQVWGNITAQGNFGFINPDNPDLKKFRWWMEGQGRFGNDASQFTQAIVRPGLGYAITDKIVIWAGYAWTPTAEPLVLKPRHPFDEHRIWQQVTWADDFSFGKLSLRSRFEQRFFDHDAPVSGSNDVAYRFRQLVKLAIPVTMIDPNLSFIVQNEVFVALNTVSNPGFISRGFDQNRAFIGLGYKAHQNATVEMGYMNQFIDRRHNPRPDQMMHNLVVNLFLNF